MRRGLTLVKGEFQHLISQGLAPRPLAVMSSPTSSGDIAARVGLDAKELDRPCEESLFPSFVDYVHPWRLVFSDLLAPINCSSSSRRTEQQHEQPAS